MQKYEDKVYLYNLLLFLFEQTEDIINGASVPGLSAAIKNQN